jgi:hypothetical protein
MSFKSIVTSQEKRSPAYTQIARYPVGVIGRWCRLMGAKA